MAVIIKNIVPRRLAENIETIQYTAVGVKTVIDKFTITNVNTVNAALNVYLVAKGDAPSVSNLILNSRTLTPKESYTCPELVGQVIEDGGYISTKADTGGCLTISATGREII